MDIATIIDAAPIRHRATCGKTNNCAAPIMNIIIPAANNANVTANIDIAKTQAVITNENKTAINDIIKGNHTGNNTISKIISSICDPFLFSLISSRIFSYLLCQFSEFF